MDTDRTRMYRLHAEVCKAMGNPHRLELLDVLRDGEMTVGDLADAAGLSVSNTSQHLSVLKSAGVVRRRKEGTTCWYRVASQAIYQAFECMGRILLEGREDEARHREYLQKQMVAD